MNILIVDDDPTNRKLLRVTLQAEGHETVEAGDGVEALEVLNSQILKNQAVDAVISDILMPRMDGYRLCHEVRKIERLKDIIFVIYTSTFTTSPDEKLALEFGADRFIRKPAPLQDIINALDPGREKKQRTQTQPGKSVAELTAMQGYSEVLVRKLEHRNSELQVTKEQLLRTNRELLERTGELQAAKATLEITANRFKSLFDNLDDVFFSLDMERRLVQISPACEKVFGLTPQAFFANPMLWKEVALPADRHLIEAGEADIFAGKVSSCEYRIHRPDGDICWVHAKIKPLLDSAGALVRIDGVVSDISVRKQLEEQLLHSQKLEAVGRLAGGIAHDFNNLLTAIYGHTEYALERIGSDNPLRADIEEIKSAGERASRLTQQLLAFSRKQVLDPAILDLNSVVADTERLLQRLIGEDIQLLAVFAPGVRPIRADRGQIEQVIVNLVVNARDAMPQGGKLTIETANVELDDLYARSHTMERSGQYVMLAVSDNGCGMSPETQSHIFEPFFTTKEPGKGTGLGLATVYGIVKQSGGHIWLYSELGKGTTFKIYLSPSQLEVPAPVPATIFSKARDGRGRTILLAEDEEVVRKLIIRILRSKGYTVLEAENGQKALQIATTYAGKIDLLLTDSIMPGMSGRNLAERLKTAQPEMRVLFMSGYTNEAVIRNDILEADTAFLQKPFGLDVLARKVHEVLNSR